MSRERAHLVLADGTTFPGYAIGASGRTIGEAVFTTGLTGYQEVLTDPSYRGQIVAMTFPEIGNTGTTIEDDEAGLPHVAGFIVHELSSRSSNWRNELDLDGYLKKHGIVAISGIDVRMLTRHLRDHGAQQAAIGTGDVAALAKAAKEAPSMAGQDLTGPVTTKTKYEWTEGSGSWSSTDGSERRTAPPLTRHVVAIDHGIKRNILRCLVDHGCRVTVMPSTATAAEVLAEKPDGVFVSNGPGDPAAVKHGIAAIEGLVGKKPLFGICLGHQMLALALGAKTYKMKFGHRGLNHPVKDLATGKIEITTQNHGFAVDVASLPKGAKMTHVHLNDDTCMGIEHESGAFSVQYHPESSAGPHDSRYLFRRFIERVDAAR